ncbi:MAG: 2-oxoacid:ferredoxin oxidoreductase subunit beta [Nitrososphaerota archaeon]|nr:2-oxoacid:ferredoxin oxidoreductase subunit beta [Nitrososphaerota archaeon]MDG6939340.1 2-oxoacid:ferredoxin oxidoreductase subunit beta [Nitrososphaerota archaeon]
MLDPKLFESDTRADWCPGCGDFGVLAALKDALLKSGKQPHEVVVVSGIGCSSNMPGYIRTYGFHGLHGRPMPVAIGIKCANPRLTVVAAAGDGDEYGIGFNHVVHAARRNDDIKLIVMNNEIYGLTTGQLSPTSRLGQKTKTSPEGSIIYPIKPLPTILGAGGTFVARTFSGDPKHMSLVIQEALKHRGFALIDAISPCVTWHNIYDEVKKLFYKLEDRGYKPDDEQKAYEAMNDPNGIPIGIFYRTEDKASFQERLGEVNGGRWPVDEVKTLPESVCRSLALEFA